MRNFDYSFLEQGLLPAKFVNIIGSIIEMKEHINGRKYKKSFEKTFTDLESAAKFQSVKWANVTDCTETPDERIKEIVNQNKNPAKYNNSECEIAGYRDALTLVRDDYANLDICENGILQIHKTLLTYSSGRSEYGTKNVEIIEVGKLIKFEPVREVIERLAFTYAEARNNSNINRLLLISCVILDFLCICPFEGDNDRMSRLLSVLLLYKNGFDAVRYISFEEQISRNQSVYNQAVHDSSAGWKTGVKNDYTPFMGHFINMVLSCYTELDGHFPQVNRSNVTKSQQIEDTVLNSINPISKREICNKLPNVSPTTVEAVLLRLKKSGSIEIVGVAQNTKYKKSDCKK